MAKITGGKKMSKKEKHHILPKEIQRQVLRVPFNKGIYDDRTVPLDEDFHDEITSQIRHKGVPVAYTIGEIDKELLEEELEEE
ncbi:MAG: hypothetical protein U9M91_01575 [Chloroflexota bacterium]|nr:hypothetical protein [Chloroflexota bacterium]